MKKLPNWREAKIPQKLKDAVEAEMFENELIIALSWPNEAKPKPVDFHWGEYDRLEGQVEEGTFYSENGHIIEKISIRKNTGDDKNYKKWQFSIGGSRWTSNTVTRGRLYKKESDAQLALQWSKAREFSKELRQIIQRKNTARLREQEEQ